jgi:hypothetical protein
MAKELKNERLKDNALMCVGRVGAILNNISIVLAAIVFLVLLAAIFSVLWGLVYAMLILIDALVIVFATIFTFGIIFLEPKLINALWFVDDIAFLFDPEILIEYTEKFMPYMPYVLGGVLVFAVASLVLLLIDKKNLSVPRVVWSIFIIVLTILGIIGVIIFVLQAVGQGGAL